jgi:hypothetical protein
MEFIKQSFLKKFSTFVYLLKIPQLFSSDFRNKVPTSSGSWGPRSTLTSQQNGKMLSHAEERAIMV